MTKNCDSLLYFYDQNQYDLKSNQYDLKYFTYLWVSIIVILMTKINLFRVIYEVVLILMI